MAETLIKRPNEFYVGLKDQGTNSVPLAFLTPFDTTAAFKKRKETVDNWAGGGYYNQSKVKHPAINVKNEALSGYKISESIKRTGSWNGGNVVWRIEDPRGFEWEIPSENMAQILIQVGIKVGGIIDAKCIIGRHGATNILIPEGSDLWKQMEDDATKLVKKAALKTITDFYPGDRVRTKDGRVMTYLGKAKLTLRNFVDPEDEQRSRSWNRSRTGYPMIESDSKGEYLIFTDKLDKYNHDSKYISLTAYKSSPVVEVVNSTTSGLNIQYKDALRDYRHYITMAAGGKPDKCYEIVKAQL